MMIKQDLSQKFKFGLIFKNHLVEFTISVKELRKMIISIFTGKTFDKIYPFMIKTLSKLQILEYFSKLLKDICRK